MLASAFGIEALQYMMMYAWSLWPQSAAVYAGSSQKLDAPLDRLGLILANSVIKAEKTGLYREYVSNPEQTLVPRGTLLLSPTLQLRAQRNQRVVVEADEFSINCVANRALKEAVDALLIFGLTPDVTKRLFAARAALSSVDQAPVSLRNLNVAILTARRGEYRLGLSIASLIKRSNLFSDGRSKFLFESPAFNDEVLFRRLYERFLREFYRFNLKGKFVGGRQYRWTDKRTQLVPVMQTDINIEDVNRVTVIDAKCTPNAIIGRSDAGFSKTLNSAHLYQMFSYMSHAGKQNFGKRIDGLLIYPKYDQSVDETIKTDQGDLRVVTVDFQCDWGATSRQLLDLLSTN